ncbi:hypothetical protein [Streptomyces abikoensis]|uniref:hypothetical protein n=1 Tax=Streptomyces abikoensis TaxID=97398 RepID=UPI00167681FE|nr:hypothetical protein [Streptomyces abikoensis]GGP44942.1 hypothetical protein GCM10010214_17330 [Streptomyces abikoensis]
MEYAAPTAGLIIAAVLFLIGVLSVNDLAARDFKITISGKVGPFQRGVLVAAAALSLTLSVVGFYLLANRPAGSDHTPPPVGQEMSVKVSSSLGIEGQDVKSETDTITIDGAQLKLTMDSDNPETSDVFHFQGDPGDQNYRVEISMTMNDDSKKEVSGTGTVYIDNQLSYKVDITGGDQPQAVLTRTA